MDEFEKRISEERKIAFDEGNKMIRIANYQRFNPPTKTTTPKGQSKFAWGVDQRKVYLIPLL